MPKIVDLNCDMGEGMVTDALLMPFISSANIACGYHAGNDTLIKKTLELCVQHQVAVGAHPSFLDRKNFGRKEQAWDAATVYDLISTQLHTIHTHAWQMGCAVHHVKPHGALYNMAAKDEVLSSVIVEAIKCFDRKLMVYGLSGSCLIAAATKAGLQTANEVFADRSYQNDGTLTPRHLPNALISSNESAVKQLLQMILEHTVTTLDGTPITIKPDTICIHGDSPQAVAFTQLIYQQLKAHHIVIKTHS